MKSLAVLPQARYAPGSPRLAPDAVEELARRGTWAYYRLVAGAVERLARALAR